MYDTYLLTYLLTFVRNWLFHLSEHTRGVFCDDALYKFTFTFKAAPKYFNIWSLYLVEQLPVVACIQWRVLLSAAVCHV